VTILFWYGFGTEAVHFGSTCKAFSDRTCSSRLRFGFDFAPFQQGADPRRNLRDRIGRVLFVVRRPSYPRQIFRIYSCLQRLVPAGDTRGDVQWPNGVGKS